VTRSHEPDARAPEQNDQVADDPRVRLAAIVDSSDDAIIGKNLNGIVTSWNAAAERLFGYRAEEMIGQSITRIIPPENIAEEADILSRLKRGERVDHFETVRLAKDGRRVDVSLTISPIKDFRGSVVGASKIARDITERKKIELALERASDALARVNEDLEERVRERTAELERATAALLKEMEQQKILEDQLRQVQKMESLGTLAGGIAHDFNNILNVILGYTLNIPREAGDPEKQAHSVAVIKETVARGVAIVQQLLALGRKNEPQLEPADLNHLLENHAALLHGAFPKTVAVALRPAPGLPPVAVDTDRLNQAILNLSVNARDAMGGAGTLTLGTESIDGARLRRRFPEARAGSYVCIAVADTGPGMESAVRERIFEPFFTTKGQGEGSGLGLTVVYGVAKDHDGFIDVESEPGRGTTFRLYLPERALDAATRRDETAGAAAYPASEVTILLADDEESQLSLVERVLSGAGYRVLVAKNGAEAVELFERHKSAVSLAVLDLGLPKLSGWQSYLAMRKIDPALRVLFASGYVEPEMRTRLRDNGIVDVLKKPYTLEQLLGQIGELLAAGGQAPVRERSA